MNRHTTIILVLSLTSSHCLCLYLYLLSIDCYEKIAGVRTIHVRIESRVVDLAQFILHWVEVGIALIAVAMMVFN